MGRTQEAYDALIAVRERFAGEFLLHNNLACYLCRLGRIDEARAAIAKAIELNPDLRLDALDDPDLEPLWTEIQRK
jgi:Flp pilus assembly protein TadD